MPPASRGSRAAAPGHNINKFHWSRQAARMPREATPRRSQEGWQGRMTINRRATTATASLVLLVFSSTAVASAEVGPILSGYGGPGSGSQVILGATLIGGSGGQSSGGAGGGGSISAPASGATGKARSAQPSSGGAPGGGTRRSAVPSGHSQSPVSKAPTTAPGRSAETLAGSSTGAQAVGLIGGNKLLLLVVLVGLLLTGLLTRGVSRPRGFSVAAQGRAPTPRRDT